MIRLTTSQARENLSDVLKAVGQGERVLLRRHGKAVAAIVPVEDLALLPPSRIASTARPRARLSPIMTRAALSPGKTPRPNWGFEEWRPGRSDIASRSCDPHSSNWPSYPRGAGSLAGGDQRPCRRPKATRRRETQGSCRPVPHSRGILPGHLHHIRDDRLIVLVLRIGHRRDIYRKKK